MEFSWLAEVVAHGGIALAVKVNAPSKTLTLIAPYLSATSLQRSISPGPQCQERLTADLRQSRLGETNVLSIKTQRR